MTTKIVVFILDDNFQLGRTVYDASVENAVFSFYFLQLTSILKDILTGRGP